MLKMCDLYFYVDVGPSYWSANIHDYLLIGIYLPLFHFLPWTLRRSILVLESERNLRLKRKEKTSTQVIVLRQFLALLRRLSDMSDGLVWQLLPQGKIR